MHDPMLIPNADIGQYVATAHVVHLAVLYPARATKASLARPEVRRANFMRTSRTDFGLPDLRVRDAGATCF